jgi:uncharacterized membrane protein YeaQ/YmgE (transglycosylase-associated protein family)
MLKGNWWPHFLALAGAIILWLLGYHYTDTGALISMATLVAVVGAYLLLAQKRGRWKP